MKQQITIYKSITVAAQSLFAYLSQNQYVLHGPRLPSLTNEFALPLALLAESAQLIVYLRILHEHKNQKNQRDNAVTSESDDVQNNVQKNELHYQIAAAQLTLIVCTGISAILAKYLCATAFPPLLIVYIAEKILFEISLIAISASKLSRLNKSENSDSVNISTERQKIASSLCRIAFYSLMMTACVFVFINPISIGPTLMIAAAGLGLLIFAWQLTSGLKPRWTQKIKHQFSFFSDEKNYNNTTLKWS